MSGGSGPSVALQIPSSPFVIVTGCAPLRISPVMRISVALGAYTRTVIVRSRLTSGETTGGPCGPPRPPPGGCAPGGGGVCADAVRQNSTTAMSDQPARRTMGAILILVATPRLYTESPCGGGL